VHYPHTADMFQRIGRYIAATSIITNLAQHGWIAKIVGPRVALGRTAHDPSVALVAR
jgi:hypothetical protein